MLVGGRSFAVKGLLALLDNIYDVHVIKTVAGRWLVITGC
jgi:hypothetical protein